MRGVDGALLLAPRACVQCRRVNLIPGMIPADAWVMNTSLRMAIEGGGYSVDTKAVADAILRRAWEYPELPVAPSRVLVPAHLFEDPAPRPPELDPVALDHGA